MTVQLIRALICSGFLNPLYVSTATWSAIRTARQALRRIAAPALLLHHSKHAAGLPAQRYAWLRKAGPTKAAVMLVSATIVGGCGGQLPGPSSGPTSQPEDVRERVVAALQKPNTVTRVRITIREPDGPGGLEYGMLSWMDLPTQRMRLEQLRGKDEVTSTTIVADGQRATYTKDGNHFHQSQLVADWDELGATFNVQVPPYLRNPALFGVHPLTAALYSGKWTPAGATDWQGTPATAWETEHPGPELPMHTYTTIFLDAETNMPLGQELRFAQAQGEPPTSVSLVTYGVSFPPTTTVDKETFDVSIPSKLHAEYGGKLDDAKSQEYTVIWFGRETSKKESHPALPLHDVYIRRSGQPDGPYISFAYRDYSAPRVEGDLLITVRPRSAWNQFEAELGDEAAWWADSSSSRQSVVIDAVQAEYAVGQRQSRKRVPDFAQRLIEEKTAASPNEPYALAATPDPYRPAQMQMVVWLPDSVALINATPMLTGPSGPDRNPFNTEALMRELVSELKILR